MSFFALGLTLCTAFTCNTYNIDTAADSPECRAQYVDHSTTFVKAWIDTTQPQALKQWLEAQNIWEEPAEVERYNFECIEYDTGSIKG